MDDLNIRIHSGLELCMLRRLRETLESKGLTRFSDLKGALQCDEITLRRHLDYWMNAGYLECLFPAHVIGREDYDPEQFPVYYRWTHTGEETQPAMNATQRDETTHKTPIGYRVLQWWKRNGAFFAVGVRRLAPC